MEVGSFVGGARILPNSNYHIIGGERGVKRGVWDRGALDEKWGGSFRGGREIRTSIGIRAWGERVTGAMWKALETRRVRGVVGRWKRENS